MMIGGGEGGGELKLDEDVSEVERGGEGRGGAGRNVREAGREVSSGRLPAVLPTL